MQRSSLTYTQVLQQTVKNMHILKVKKVFSWEQLDMAAGASSGKAMFAEVSEPRLYLSLAALWHIQDEGFLPPQKETFYRRIFGTFIFCIFKGESLISIALKKWWFICSMSNWAREMYLIERGNNFSQLQIPFASHAYSAVWKDALVKNWTLWLMAKFHTHFISATHKIFQSQKRFIWNL